MTDKKTAGFALSFLIVSLINALLVIFKEEYSPLKDWMASTVGHHWAAHGFFIIVLFVALGLLLSLVLDESRWTAERSSVLLIIGVVVGGLLISGFYLIH